MHKMDQQSQLSVKLDTNSLISKNENMMAHSESYRFHFSEWNKMTTLQFDMRSSAQIKVNDTINIPEYVAVFDHDPTTFKQFKLAETDRLEFFLQNQDYDRAFGDIYLKVGRDPPITSPKFDQFSIQIVNANDEQFVCSRQIILDEDFQVFTCNYDGIKLVFQPMSPSGGLQYAFYEIIAPSLNQKNHKNEFNQEVVFQENDADRQLCASSNFNLDGTFKNFCLHCHTIPFTGCIQPGDTNYCDHLTGGYCYSYGNQPQIYSFATWVQSATIPFTFSGHQGTNSCYGFTVDQWIFTCFQSNNADKQSLFTVTSNTGQYTVGPFSGSNYAGIYKIKLTGVHSTSGTFQSITTSLKRLVLNVKDPCIINQTAKTTATIDDITLTAFDPATSLGSFSGWTGTANGIICQITATSVSIAPETAIADLQTFTLQTATNNFLVQSTSMQNIGTFTATLHSGSLWSTTFTVTVKDPCLVTTLTAETIFSTMNCKVLQCSVCSQLSPSKNTALDASIGKTLELCGGVSHFISDFASTGVTSLSSTKLNVDSGGLIWVTATQSDEVGLHEVTLVMFLTLYPEIKTTAQTFILDIQPQDLIDISPQVVAQTWELSTVTPFSYQISIDLSTSCGFTPSSWTVQATSTGNPTSTQNFQTISSTGLFSAGPFQDLSVVGVYTITVLSLSINGAQTTRISDTTQFPRSFSLTVTDPCTSANVFNSVIPDQECYVFDPVTTSSQFTSFTYEAGGSTTSTLCGSLTYTVSVDLLSAANMITSLTVNSVARTLQYQSYNMDQIGTFTVKLEGYLTGYPNQKSSTTFKMTVQNPCWKTTLVWISTWSAMTYNVSQTMPANYQTSYDDSVDISQNLGVRQLCGELTYQSFSVSPSGSVGSLTASELNLSPSGMISVATSNNLTVGLHTISFDVFLSRFTNITKSQSIQLRIYPCFITHFTAIHPIQQIYTINNPALTWQVTAAGLAIQTPNCGYTQTSTTKSQSLPSLLSVSPTASIQSFSLYTRLRSLAGAYSILIDVSLSGYPFSPVPSTTATQSLTVIDPCLQDPTPENMGKPTIIQGPTNITGNTQVQNFIAFAGYNQTSSSNYTFNDSYSKSFTLLTDSSDYCGKKITYFSINSTITTILKGSNTEKVTFSPLANSTFFGTQLATMFICMEENPENCLTIEFNVTTLGSKAPFIPSQNYQTSQQRVIIPIDPPFQVLPLDFKFDSTFKIKFTAYILTKGANLTSPINMSSSNLTLIQDQSWIQFNASNQSISVFTHSNQFQGIWTIVIVQSFDQFPQVNPFTQFYMIMAPRVAQLGPPYFQPALKNWYIDICPGKQQKLWKFQIPTPIDPTNSTVTIKVGLNPVYFFYQNASQTIFQTKEQSKNTNQTINIELKNELNASATFSMKIEFKCKVVNTTQVVSNFTPTLEQKKQTFWPEAYIKNVDSNGLMQIVFRQRMKVPENTSEILNGTIKINDTDFSNLIITVIPGRLSDKQKLNFTSEVVNFTSQELRIQLKFQNEKLVSLHNQFREQIKVQIYGVHLFADTRANQMYPGIELKSVYLRVMASEGVIQQALGVASQAQGAITSLVISNFLLAFFVSQPLQVLLGSIRHLQVIIHAMLLKLSYPASTNIYFGMLMNVLTFQFISFVNFFNQVLSLDPYGIGNNPYKNQFNNMGYDAMYIIQNFGMMCFTVFITPLLYFVVLLLHKKFPQSMQNQKVSLHKQMFYGSWIQLIYETYLFLGVCAMINCYYLKFDTYGNFINSLCALLCSFVLITFPIFVIIFYNIPINYKKVLNRDGEFMDRYGKVIKGLNFLRLGQKVTLYPFFSLLRKVCLIYVVVFMQDRPVFSIFTLIYQAIIMITLVGYIPPFESRIENFLELLNEAYILLVNYQLFTFTDFLLDVETREYVGYSLVITTFTCIFINLSVVVQKMASISIHNLKIKYYEYRNSQRLKQIQEDRKQKKLQQIIEHKKKVLEERLRKEKEENNIKAKKSLHHRNITNQQLQQDAIALQKQQKQQKAKLDKKLLTENQKELNRRVRYDQWKQYLEQEESYEVKVALEQQRKTQYVYEYVKNSLGWQNAERKRLQNDFRTMNEKKRQILRSQLEKRQKQEMLQESKSQSRTQKRLKYQKRRADGQLAPRDKLVVLDYSDDDSAFDIDHFQLENHQEYRNSSNYDIEQGIPTSNQNLDRRKLVDVKTKHTKSLVHQIRSKLLKPSTTAETIFSLKEFGEMRPDQLKQLRELFSATEQKAPENWSEVDRKITYIFSSKGTNLPLWDKALTQFKKHSKDWQFARAHDEKIDDAIKFRNGTIDKAIQKYNELRCSMVAKMQMTGLTHEEYSYFWGNLVFGDVTDKMSTKDKFNLYKMIVSYGKLYKQLQQEGQRPLDPPGL